MSDINDFSNPKIVFKNARKLYGNNIMIQLSTRKNKKYMIYDKDNNKWVHFGFFGMEDYTKHKNDIRKQNFENRNHKWAFKDEYSPAFLSYYLLWNIF